MVRARAAACAMLVLVVFGCGMAAAGPVERRLDLEPEQIEVLDTIIKEREQRAATRFDQSDHALLNAGQDVSVEQPQQTTMDVAMIQATPPKRKEGLGKRSAPPSAMIPLGKVEQVPLSAPVSSKLQPEQVKVLEQVKALASKVEVAKSAMIPLGKVEQVPSSAPVSSKLQPEQVKVLEQVKALASKVEVTKEPEQKVEVAKEPEQKVEVAKEPEQKVEVAKEPEQKVELAKQPEQKVEVAKQPEQKGWPSGLVTAKQEASDSGQTSAVVAIPNTKMDAKMEPSAMNADRQEPSAMVPAQASTPAPAQASTPAQASPSTPAQASPSTPVSCEAHPNSRRWMIGVVTAPAHVSARNAIRETFGTNANTLDIDVKYFVASLSPTLKDREKVAAQLASEKDIVSSHSYMDSYENLAHKTKHIMEYAYEHCYAGVFKVDDDTFLNVDKIDRALKQSGLEETYAGKFFENSEVIKNPKSKWYGYDQYPHDTWPTYACGAGYYVGRKGLKHINDNRASMSVLRIEDAGLGIWLEHAGMKRLEMSGNVLDYTLNPDLYYHNPLNPSEMHRLQAGNTVFELKACDKTEEFGCACHGSPYFSDEERGACMNKFIHGEYDENHVAGGPRLVHMMIQMQHYL